MVVHSEFVVFVMLPPLNLADSKGGFFSRKRVDGVEATENSSARKTGSIKLLRPSQRASIHVHSPRPTQPSDVCSHASAFLSPREACSNRSNSLELTEISMIPREFFVVETNSVLLPPHYPPNQYKSTLNAKGQWETVVFPALTPHNRQQVMYLRQTLDKMRAAIPQIEEKSVSTGPESEYANAVTAERRSLTIEYTNQEIKIYSFCFHELTRQIKCICKEQCALLQEIRERYNAAVSRLIEQLHLLSQQSNQQKDQLTELVAKHEHLVEENNRLTRRLDELEQQLKADPSIAEAQEVLKRRGMLKFRVRRRSYTDVIDEHPDEDDSDERSDKNSDSEIDEEETEWRRQRNSSSVARPVDAKQDSTKELHLAATRLQAAFQKYQARKEQTRITIRVEKQAAAMDIQRSFRGFQDRQLALHRRAVMRTIMRRREENAAVELMQANVRAYLLNRRRSAKFKLSVVNTFANPGENEALQVVSALPVAAESTPTTDLVELSSNENIDENALKTGLPDSNNADAEKELNPRQALGKLLSTFRELASVITKFRHLGARNSQDEDDENAITTADEVESADDEPALRVRSASATPSDSFDEEDLVLFQQTMQEAQALVGSLHVVLGTVPEENYASDDDELSIEDNDAERAGDNMAASTDLLENLDQQIHNVKDDFAGQQPDSDGGKLGDELDEFNDDLLSIPFGERDAMRLQNYAELHLDDSLWSSATYYPASTQDIAEADARLAVVLSSREQRKRLVSLKQFISDIYDTIVGKLKELPTRRLEETIASRCHLSLSFVEWRRQRSQICSRAVAANQPGEVTVPVNFGIDELTREHFRCQLGLKQLIDAALKSLRDSIEDFSAVDHDVKRFQEFLENERSEEELIFCCMCRYICANCLASDSATGTSSYQRQPVFHPITMREVIAVPHALDLAKVLFRVEDERSIVESDTPFTEVENVVYRQYLPTNGYHQFEAIVRSFFIDADSQTASMAPWDDVENEDQTRHELRSNTCRRPPGSPRHASTLLRPTNYNQFHVKQYNTQAARSPLVRHQQDRRPQFSMPTSASATEGGPKWVYFEEVLALLIKYRGEMNHFHLFSYWVQELFSLAASNSTTTGDNSRLSRSMREQAPNQPKLLDDTAFVETLSPLSLGPSERELRNIFHNSLRQRKLQVFMPLHVFTSVALLLLRNGLLSVSSYAPLQRNRVLLSRNGDGISTGTHQRSPSLREQNEDKAWRDLALKWRTQEAAFESAIEAIYHEASPSNPPIYDDQVDEVHHNVHDSKSRAAHALQLLQLRQELYDLFASRAGQGRDLKRAREIYEILVNERLARVGGDTSLLDAHLKTLQPSPSSGTWSATSFSFF